MSKVPKEWEAYLSMVSVQSEIVPECIPMWIDAVRDGIKRIPLAGVLANGPHLACSIRYKIPTHCQCDVLFEVGARHYGDWRLYGPTGTVIITPPLLLAAEAAPFLVIRAQDTIEVSIAIDCQKIRRLP